MNKASPAFFKVFIAEISDQDLKIPPAFTQRLEEALPSKVQLKDRHNNVWEVKVEKIGSCWHFLDGWATFSRDNFLSSGDILVFEYLCDGFFYVLMYGTLATEKNIIPFTTTPEGVVKKQEHVSEYSIYDSDDDYNKTEDYKYSMRKGSDNESGEDEYADDDDYDDNKEFALEQATNTTGGGAGTNITMRRDCYGMEIFQAGLARQPTNPYFVAKVMQKRKGDLFVPKDLMKDFDIEFADEIFLVDPEKRRFRGKCKKWSDGRVVISGSWRSLCRLNLVAQDDQCICEFVDDAQSGQPFLSISFVRGNRLRDL